MNKSAGKRRMWFFRMLAVAIPSIAGLVAIGCLMTKQERIEWTDTGIRLRRPPVYLEEKQHEWTGARFLYDPRLGWRNIPGWQGSTFGGEVRINAKGLRDRDHPYDKPPGMKRLLVLGDSFTWGFGVDQRAMFTEVLERRLVRDGKNWEIINTGVVGWGNDQEYLFLIDEGLRYEPDIVLLAFYTGNDMTDNHQTSLELIRKPLFINEQLVLTNMPVPLPHESSTPIRNEDPFGIKAAIIGAMKSVCDDAGIPFIVMQFGHSYDPDAAPEEEKLFADEIEKSLQERLPGLDRIMIDPELDRRGYPLDRLQAGLDDLHWNAVAHRAVAGILYDRLFAEDQLNANP